MIEFDNNELEVILITYNRSKFVEEWIINNVSELLARNIKLCIYDSSTDNKTKFLIEQTNNTLINEKIHYEYISPDYSVGHVVLYAIMNCTSKYVWVVGDSRCHKFSDLDLKVFPYVKKGIDHIVIKTINNEENDGKIYDNKTEMLEECLVSMTCTGFYIYKTAIFEKLKKDKTFFDYCYEKYNDNYGFTWMGYFLESYAQNCNYRTVFTVIPTIEIEPEKKVKRWNQKFFKCWCSDLCNIIDNISESYFVNEDILKSVWKIIGFDTSASLLRNCEDGVLTPQIYEEYKYLLVRVSSSIDKIKDFAYADNLCLERVYSNWKQKEELQFREKVYEVIDNIIEINKGKNICIYGAGKGGKIIAECLNEKKVVIKCFYDKKADIVKEFLNIKVCPLSEVNEQEDCILVGLLGSYASILENVSYRKAIYYINFM